MTASPPAASPSRNRSIWIIGGLLIALTICGWIWWGAPTPEAELHTAQAQINHPDRALALVRSSIQAAGGEFPEAQVFECRLLLKLNRNRDAILAFKSIANPQACPPEELSLLGDQAVASHELVLASQAYLAVPKDVIGKDSSRLKRLIYALYTRENNAGFEDTILTLCRDYAPLAPEDPFPWLISSSLYHERGVPNAAVEAYRAALKCPLPPEETYRVRLQLAELALLLGDLRLAREQAEALETTAHSVEAQNAIHGLNAELLIREGHFQKALPILDQLIEKRPQWGKTLALRGRCYYELQDFAKTVRDLSAAVEIDPFDQQSHYLLGQAFLRQKDTIQANRHLNRSRELTDLMAQILTLENQLRNDLYNRELKLRLAELNEKRGDREKAAAWRRGAEVSPADSRQ